MDSKANALSPAAVARELVGWGVKYMACGLLALALLLCLGAVLFVLVVVWGPHGAWVGYLAGLLRLGHPAQGHVILHSADLGTMLRRGFLLLTLVLTALAVLWRWLRRKRGAVATTPADSATLTRHVRLHVGRRMLIGLGAVSVVFACAFAAIPFARMAAGASHMGLVLAFVALYVVAFVFTAIYLAFDLAADWILDG